jgi:hypothetical protein
VLALEGGGRPADIVTGERIVMDELPALVKLGFLEMI